jgi:hypothetical protein
MIAVTVFILLIFILILGTIILKNSDSPLNSLVVIIPITCALALTALLIYLNDSIFKDPPNDQAQLISSVEQELRDQLTAQPLNTSLYRGLMELLIQSQRYEEASEVGLQFEANIQNLPLNDQLLIAESFILVDQNKLITEDIRNLLLAVHTEDDLNIKALWYLGLSYLLINDTVNAEVYWRRLSLLGPPEPLDSFISGQLDQLRVADTGSSNYFDINIRTHLVEAFANNITDFNQYSRVYVIAKNLDGPIPFAVAQYNTLLPDQIYHIDQSNIMLAANQSLLPDSLLIEIRISFSGDPIARVGDLYGQLIIDTLKLSGSQEEPLIIEIDKSY